MGMMIQRYAECYRTASASERMRNASDLPTELLIFLQFGGDFFAKATAGGTDVVVVVQSENKTNLRSEI